MVRTYRVRQKDLGLLAVGVLDGHVKSVPVAFVQQLALQRDHLGLCCVVHKNSVSAPLP